MKKLILAGDIKQYRQYLRENTLLEKDCTYVKDMWSVRGTIASAVIIAGTFWDREDAGELYEIALSRIRKNT